MTRTGLGRSVASALIVELTRRSGKAGLDGIGVGDGISTTICSRTAYPRIWILISLGRSMREGILLVEITAMAVSIVHRSAQHKSKPGTVNLQRLAR